MQLYNTSFKVMQTRNLPGDPMVPPIRVNSSIGGSSHCAQWIRNVGCISKMFCSLMENVATKTCGSNDSSRTSQCEAEHVNWISFLATVIHVRMKHRCCRGRRKSYSRTSIFFKNFNHIQELQSYSGTSIIFRNFNLSVSESTRTKFFFVWLLKKRRLLFQPAPHSFTQFFLQALVRRLSKTNIFGWAVQPRWSVLDPFFQSILYYIQTENQELQRIKLYTLQLIKIHIEPMRI